MSSPLRIIEVRIGDEPDAWARAGFTVAGNGCAQVSTVRLRFVGATATRGIVGWTVAGVASDEIDGLPGAIADDEVTDALASTPAHPNTTTTLDHVVIATPDVARTVEAFVALGCAPKRERRAGSDATPLRQVFVRAGEVIVEIVGPLDPAPPPASQPATSPRSKGPVRSARFWGLAFTVADLDRCVASLGEGCGAARDAVQPGRRIATLRHEPLGISVPTAFMS